MGVWGSFSAFVRTWIRDQPSELYDSVSGTIACGEKMKPRVTNVLTFY